MGILVLAIRDFLGGEAKEVHHAYMDEWDFTNPDNPNIDNAREAEGGRAI